MLKVSKPYGHCVAKSSALSFSSRVFGNARLGARFGAKTGVLAPEARDQLKPVETGAVKPQSNDRFGNQPATFDTLCGNIQSQCCQLHH